MRPQSMLVRPRLGVALYGDLTYDSRVRRECRTLAEAGFDVTIACLAGQPDEADLRDVQVLANRPTASHVLPGSPNPFDDAGGRLRTAARRLRWLVDYVGNLRAWGRAAVLGCGRVDAWHINDFTGLAAVLPALDRAVPVVYDVHDLFLEDGTALRLPGPARALLRAYEGRLVRRVQAVVTVNEGLADVITRRYRPRRVEVVHNCPYRWVAPPTRPTHIRNAAGIPIGAPVVLYHGGLFADRGIESLMAAMLRPELHAAHLVLMGDGEARERYTATAHDSSWQGRLHVLDPVRPHELIPWIASADVGAVLRSGARLNDFLSTPNKLFECFAAGTPVVASDFPLLRQIVLDGPEGSLGSVCDPGSVDGIVEALRSILDLDESALAALGRRCRAAANRRWNWESESEVLPLLYRELIHPAR